VGDGVSKATQFSTEPDTGKTGGSCSRGGTGGTACTIAAALFHRVEAREECILYCF